LAGHVQLLPLKLARAYHAIIEEEFTLIKKIQGVQSNIIDLSNRIAPVCHNESELTSIVSNRLGISQTEAQTIVDMLIKKGFLINIAYDDTSCTTNQNCCTSTEQCYRSFHMDMALRSTDIRYYPGAAPMTASSKLAVVKQEYASPEDRCILPSGKTTCPNNPAAQKLAQRLNKTLRAFIGDQRYTDALIEAIEKYLKKRAGGKQPYGYDYYQAAAIVEALSRAQKGNAAAVIVAPTGSGKTEVFTTITLAILFRRRVQGREEKALLLYPRKMLEIDQANRFLELMKILASALENQGLKPLSFGIRDGDARQIEEKLYFEGRTLLRGLTCDKGKLYAVKEKGGVRLACCDAQGSCVDDIQAKKVFKIERNEIKSADIIITNIWTLGFRLLSLTSRDLDICDLEKTAVIVLDEAHEYDSVQLGDLSRMLRELTLLRKNRGLDEPYIIVSTATLRDPLQFTEKLTRRTNRVTDLTFNALQKSYGLRLQGERLFITLFVQLLPTTGWNTYISEWAAAILYTWLATKERSFIPQQSIVFINNVRELNRTARSIFQETLSLGSPLDNLCRRKSICKSPKDALDTFKHICCLKKGLCDRAASNGPLALLFGHYEVVFRDLTQEKRAEIYENFQQQKLGMLFATSSLELGMDYPNVSIILNAGLDKPDSLIQRIGRGGRSLYRTLNTVLAIVLIRNNPLDYRFYADPTRVEQIALRQSNLLPMKKIADSLISLQAVGLLRYAVMKELARLCTVRLRCSKRNTLQELIKAIQGVTIQELKELDIDPEIKNQLLAELQTDHGILRNILELTDLLGSVQVEKTVGEILYIVRSKILDELDQLINSGELDDKDEKMLSKLRDELEEVLVKPLSIKLRELLRVMEELESILAAFKIPTEEELSKLCTYGANVARVLGELEAMTKREGALWRARRRIREVEDDISNSNVADELAEVVEESLTDVRRLISDKEKESIKIKIKLILDKLNYICKKVNEAT